MGGNGNGMGSEWKWNGDEDTNEKRKWGMEQNPVTGLGIFTSTIEIICQVSTYTYLGYNLAESRGSAVMRMLWDVSIANENDNSKDDLEQVEDGAGGWDSGTRTRRRLGNERGMGKKGADLMSTESGSRFPAGSLCFFFFFRKSRTLSRK